MAYNDLSSGGYAAGKRKKKLAEEGDLPSQSLPEEQVGRPLPSGILSGLKTGAEPYYAAQNASAGAPGNLSGASANASGKRDLEFHPPEEDQEARQRYEDALAALEALQGKAPNYDNRYDAQIRELYEQIASRSPFRYDSAGDPLYQQYRQSYAAQGRMAMRDTMGQAADLTGGYGSSYAQSVSQQQYDAYLQRLADVLPETYGMALDAWTAEGKELQQRYAAATGLEQSEYERYLDELGQYNLALDRAREDADTAYERKIEGEERDYQRAVDDYKRRVAEYERAQKRKQAAAKTSKRRGRKKKQTADMPKKDRGKGNKDL